MDHESVGRYWDDNAEAWTKQVRAGYEHYRDGLNTPAFLAMLPEIDDFAGLDVGCGEGHNTRRLAERGARVIGIDISATFVRLAREAEEAHPLGIRYEVASAVDLPFGDASFDFVTAFMSLMDIPETERARGDLPGAAPRRVLAVLYQPPLLRDASPQDPPRPERARKRARSGRLFSEVGR